MGVSHYNSASCLVGVHWPSVGGSIMCLISHVTSHEHLIEVSYQFVGRSSLQYVNNFICLVPLKIVRMQM